MYLISPDKKQYKANLHCHSTLSDGRKTPEELKELYRSHGYDVLSITDHEIPKSHNDLNEPGFLMLTGYEAYIRPSATCTYDRFASEVHLNLFARDPENETSICYNRAFCKYLNDEQAAQLVKAGSQRPREYKREYINEFIRTAGENGYLVAYNHPYWSMEDEADILAYEGYFSMEMCNYGSYVTNHLEYNAAVYDKMLRAGKHVFCHSGDDNHNTYPVGHTQSDSFGAFTMILADDLTYENMINAMERGEMYSSMGPLFKEVSVEDDHIHVECSEVASICAYFGSKTPKRVIAEPGQVLTSADIPLDADARYVRVSIFDREGKAADTRGFFRDELGLPPLTE